MNMSRLAAEQIGFASKKIFLEVLDFEKVFLCHDIPSTK
jgi:hypothetical protein